uniref:Survival of motor neuron-related-splicing factor 30 n=1 Tax=Lygus hesperus TaxID=30085 RepID=A0A0A9Z1N9_LYGHE
MEELDANLQNYKLQLQQVEAALTTNPDNEELLKLKSDLEEVITLTKDLIKAQLLEDKVGDDDLEEKDITDLSNPEPLHSTKKDWQPGDICMAMLVSDGQYYEAQIESVEGDEVSVIFTHNKSSEVTTVEFIRELPRSEGSSKFKKQPLSKVREYQKKKKMKKLQRYKQLEEERETEKNKWLAFSSKSSKKGVIKKSIFASPDNVNGRVGIGTCGVSGKGMTEFPTAEKWKK